MSRKILVVDDDPVMHRVLTHYLHRNGYEILKATTGRQALDLAVQEKPQLIVLDVRMPEMGGLAALRQLKEMEATKGIPVIVVTVHADRATHMESDSSGADAFIAKPFRPAELLATLERLVPPDPDANKTTPQD